jgi:uncharacterized protein YndB with AHSA1/START domain
VRECAAAGKGILPASFPFLLPPAIVPFSMGALHLEIQIAAPLDRVFVFFVPQRMPLWYAPEMETCFEISGGESDFRVGQKVKITGHLGKREVSLVVVVQRYDWMRALEWEFQDAYGVRGRQMWEVEQFSSLGGAGKAPAQIPTIRVVMHEWYTFPGRLGRWLDPILMRPSICARDRRMLENLKRLAEGVKD